MRKGERLLSLAAKRYAQTFFAQAKKAGEADALLIAWRRMEEAIESEPLIADYLRDPGLSPDTKLALLAKVYKKELPKSIAAGMRMLIEAQRYELFAEMADAIQMKSDEDQGVLRVVVRSAHPMSAAQLHRIEKLVKLQEGREPVIATEIDPALIGGIQVQLGHRVMDASVKQMLTDMNQKLHHVQVH